MAGQAVRFKTPYNNYDPATIFQVDPATKTLSPFGSGRAYQEAGFQFGQEQLVDPAAYAGFNVGPIINTRAAALDSVKTQLNTFQNETFNAEAESAKRRSSALAESIATDQQGYEDALTEYKGLKDKLAGLSAPNLQQAYTEARTAAGIPGLESQFTDTRATRRELPYVNRAATGNAGVATEGQLAADTYQKDIPLEIREANLIDRLTLAADFVNNSLKFKQADSESARASITDAASMLGDVINMTRTHLQDLKTDQSSIEAKEEANRQEAQARQDAGLQFRLENNITTPFFNSGGTIYDSGSLEGIPDEKIFQQKYGMTLQDAEARGLVGKLDGGVQASRGLVLDLASNYPDAGIVPSDSLEQAQAKIKGSRIYQDQVRGPVGSGGGGGGSIGPDGVPVLTDAQRNQIANSPEAKKLLALQDLTGKLDAYKSLILTTGFAPGGVDKAKVDSLYADLKIAYKEAANLGALTGPDVAIIQEAIKPASGISNLPSFLLSGKTAGVAASIDQALTTVRRQYENNSKSLLTRYPQAAADPYVSNLTASAQIEQELKDLQDSGVISDGTPAGEKKSNFFTDVLNFFNPF